MQCDEKALPGHQILRRNYVEPSTQIEFAPPQQHNNQLKIITYASSATFRSLSMLKSFSKSMINFHFLLYYGACLFWSCIDIIYMAAPKLRQQYSYEGSNTICHCAAGILFCTVIQHNNAKNKLPAAARYDIPSCFRHRAKQTRKDRGTEYS